MGWEDKVIAYNPLELSKNIQICFFVVGFLSFLCLVRACFLMLKSGYYWQVALLFISGLVASNNYNGTMLFFISLLVFLVSYSSMLKIFKNEPDHKIVYMGLIAWIVFAVVGIIFATFRLGLYKEFL